MNLILYGKKYTFKGELDKILGDLGRSWINLKDLGSIQGAEEFSFMDLGKSMHYFQGSREHRPPGASPI